MSAGTSSLADYEMLERYGIDEVRRAELALRVDLDLASGETQNVTQTEERLESAPRWLPGDPQRFLAGSFTGSRSASGIPMSCSQDMRMKVWCFSIPGWVQRSPTA